jgi:hypothetical protein
MFDENGEVTPEQLNSSRGPEIHTVPTREKHEFIEKMRKFLDEEMEKSRISGVTAYS